jgi:hypothetical protein
LRDPGTPIRVRETPSTFHQLAQRNAFRRPDVASTIQIVHPLESIADTQAPTPSGLTEIVSDYFPVLHAVSDSVAATSRVFRREVTAAGLLCL